MVEHTNIIKEIRELLHTATDITIERAEQSRGQVTYNIKVTMPVPNDKTQLMFNFSPAVESAERKIDL